MATTGSGHMPGSFALRSGFPTFGNFGNALLERGNPGLRKSTPDSEALASSDEEVEQSRLRSVAQRKAQSSARRSSLLAEQNQDTKRHSFVGNSVYSPATGSQPNTPGGSTDNWSTKSPNIGTWNASTAYPFGANIWGTKETNPSRLAEAQRQENTERHSLSNSSHSNAPVHRSLSFSVGQSDHESHPSNTSAPIETSSRPSQYLTRRSSRQSNLTTDLERVDEVEHAPVGSGIGQSRTQTRAMSSASTQFRTGGLRNSIHERSEVAIDDIDEPIVQSRVPIRNAPSRRLSDIQTITSLRGSAAAPFSTTSFLRNSRENLQWSSGTDLAPLETIPASRRHSFADVPTRRGSLGSTEDDLPGPTYETAANQASTEQEAWCYKTNNAVNAEKVTAQVQQQLMSEHEQAIFGGQPMYGLPHTPSSIGSFQGPSSTPLFVVNFKLCRSDIFYIQEGSGLSVQEGDLVIVDADRGMDLGCIQHARVTWEAARKYKAIYAEQQFQWLMMFSQQSRSGQSNLFNPNAVVPGRGGLNLPGGPGSRDNEIKPKLIKRLAQAHEIEYLQNKEGNEAKAKRVCQTRVTEHNLNMEILDAEFQMDGKKLTFYFFSTEYINFNALVTDLFKLYKTRIWMSAINPASFQSPVSQLGLTPIYGNTGLGVSNAASPATNMYEEQRDDQRYYTSAPSHQIQPRVMPQLFYPGYGQSGQVAQFGQFGPTQGQGQVQVNQQIGQGDTYPPYHSNFPQQSAPTDPFSSYNNPSAFGMPTSRPQSLGLTRPATHTRNVQARNDDSFNNQFRSLSLAG